MEKRKRKALKKTCPKASGQRGISSVANQPHHNAPTAQRARILRWFFNKSQRLSTLDAREELGIMSPANRIKELRAMGHEIFTDKELQYDVSGTKHKTGVYVYMGFCQGNQKEGAVSCHV